MFSKFFIDRPVFAAVLSIIIVMAGVLVMQGLPVSQYPEITPPQVQVRAVYPGANAQVLSNTVAQPIETQMNGVEGMIYMSSTSTNNGEYTLTVTFEVGTDINMAQVLVQNRVSQVESTLPQEVQRMGLTVNKRSSSILMFASLISPDERYDALYLGNYASLHIRDQLTRIPGVGDVMLFGVSEYAMRIWLDPYRMKTRGLTTSDVLNAIREQNVQVAAGQIGELPLDGDQDFQYPINVRGRLETTEEFGDIIIKKLPDGGMLRVRDVAKVELGAQSYSMSSLVNGQDSAAIGIFLQPGANALEVASKVRERLDELAVNFPPGVDYLVPFDTTTFVEASINEVMETLAITVILVVLVILVFLQNWRASLIPVITIPVSILGTLAVMALLDVSINMLSLFGLVLAIGIVVDDAIVVVENVIRHMDESGMSPRKATILTMKEVTGPVIATTLVLLSVFVPTAFLAGTTGQLYRQFALTIATATVFSTINALTLSPALSALILRPTGNGKLNFFARGFNAMFDRVQRVYGRIVAALIRRAAATLLIFVVLSGAAFTGFIELPKGFVPNEDQGWAMLVIQLPDAASLKRTKDVVATINKKLDTMPGVASYVAIPGYSVLDSAAASNSAVIWAVFEPWEERLPKGLDLKAMIGQLWGVAAGIQEASVYAFPPPPILGLGNAGGFAMQIQDRANLGMPALQDATMKMMIAANQHPQLRQVFSTFRANVPQLQADIDRTQAKSLDIPLSNIFETLQVYLGSVYVNDFNKFGKTYQVRVQADAEYRTSVDDITRLEVRNSAGEMIPLKTVVDVRDTLGPQTITRYNLFPAAMLNGQGAPGVSSAQAMEVMEQLAKDTLPRGMGFEWTDLSYQEKASQGKTLAVLLMAIFFVYLVLCAQYESLTLPTSVILSVPLAVLGTVAGVYIRGMDINIYTQIGLVLLVALSCKTSILITEFAKSARDEGESITGAALNAATLRFRPILMTAATFILGMIPLVIATGAGANSRQALGSGVFNGMLSATILLLFFVPTLYAVVQKATEALMNRYRSRRMEAPALPKEEQTEV